MLHAHTQNHDSVHLEKAQIWALLSTLDRCIKENKRAIRSLIPEPVAVIQHADTSHFIVLITLWIYPNVWTFLIFICSCFIQYSL